MENKIEAKNLDLYYGEKHALKNVSLNTQPTAYCFAQLKQGTCLIRLNKR